MVLGLKPDLKPDMGMAKKSQKRIVKSLLFYTEKKQKLCFPKEKKFRQEKPLKKSLDLAPGSTGVFILVILESVLAVNFFLFPKWEQKKYLISVAEML